jgi:hypothetical protein
MLGALRDLATSPCLRLDMRRDMLAHAVAEDVGIKRV